MCQLQPKTYCCFPKVTPSIANLARDILNGTHTCDQDDVVGEVQQLKKSMKGCSKRLNLYTAQMYMNVLLDERCLMAENKSFMMRDWKVYATTLFKRGPSYAYYKRQVQADGISTILLPDL